MVQDLLRVLVAHLVGHVGQLVRGAHLRGERLDRHMDAPEPGVR